MKHRSILLCCLYYFFILVGIDQTKGAIKKKAFWELEQRSELFLEENYGKDIRANSNFIGLKVTYIDALHFKCADWSMEEKVPPPRLTKKPGVIGKIHFQQ